MTHHRRIASALTFAAFTALAASCGSDSGGGASGGETEPMGIESAEVDPVAVESAEVDAATRERARKAAVDVRARGCGPRVAFGSGSLIDDNTVITAAHVVAGASEAWIIDATGTEHPADVVLFDPVLDIAVLRSDDVPGEALTLRSPARTGERGVVALLRLDDDDWVTDELDVTVLRTVNIDTTDIYLDADVTRRGFEIDGGIDPGDSGSIVVFPDGAAGVVWARSTERAGRAWTVELPTSVTESDQLASLSSPVDVGPCLD